MPKKYQPKTDRKYRSSKLAEPPAKFVPGFLTQLDGRTELARALRDRFENIASDLGGLDTLSTVKASLLERFIWLEATLCRIESDLATTADPKAASEVLARWIQGCNALLGIAKTLGIERQMKNVDLRTYVAGKGGR